LAKHYDGSTVVKLEDIAQRESISSSFLVQILNELKRSDLVDSKRGKAGGYVLARPPAAITLREVVQAVEPGLLAIPAVSKGDSGPAVTNVWNDLSETISERLDGVNLEMVANEAAAPMYHI
jgi:Rrf2 family iron-sulfur cluster assembly transcriptional regulator